MSEFGKRLIESAEQAVAFAKGEADLKGYRVHIPDEIDVKRIRQKLKMSQAEFAEAYGFSLRTIQEWEQGRMVPSGAAKNFLVVLDREPAAVRRALVAAE
jgi:putative transcriptional regulator